VKEIFILLGSNRGDRPALLGQARNLIHTNCGTLLCFSSLFETEPWGFADDTPFLNQVIEIESALPAEELLAKLLEIEEALGRMRDRNQKLENGKGCSCGQKDPEHDYKLNLHNPISNFQFPVSINQQSESSYSARTIDLDILFYGNKMIFTDTLMIPHPRLHLRRFTLEPLNEIAPSFQHPVLKKTISRLLRECNDTGVVKKYKG
jgi:2-amino-4-hydroxy-6-hydroxymethyldihydropteridine diphosphokinase